MIPVIVHNLKGYDEHLILKHMKDWSAENDVHVIANNMEKYLWFTVKSLKFIDSYQFLGSSLESLVNNLPKDNIVHTIAHF